MPSSLCPAPKQVPHLEGPHIAYSSSWGCSYGGRGDGSVRGRVRHSNLAEGQTTPPTLQQLWAGLAPGEDPPSSLAVLAPEMPSTLSLNKKPITATFSVCGQGSGPGHSVASGLCMILGQQTRGS